MFVFLPVTLIDPIFILGVKLHVVIFKMHYRYCKTKSYSQSSETFTDFVHIIMTQIFYISGTISADIVNIE